MTAQKRTPQNCRYHIVYRDDGKYLITRRSLARRSFRENGTVPGGGLTTDDYIGTHQRIVWPVVQQPLKTTIRREVKEVLARHSGE